jgi:F0F1-type ATP synthase gamma subunit
MEITTYIVVGVAVSVSSYVAYKFIDKIVLPKSRKFFLKKRTRKLLKENKLLGVYLDTMELSFLLAQKVEEDPKKEISKIWVQLTRMKSFMDENPSLKKVIDVMTTGIVLAEKTNRNKYHVAFLEFATDQLNRNGWKWYCILMTINMFLKDVEYLSHQALKILITEMVKGNVFDKEN